MNINCIPILNCDVFLVQTMKSAVHEKCFLHGERNSYGLVFNRHNVHPKPFELKIDLGTSGTDVLVVQLLSENSIITYRIMGGDR